MVKGTTTRSPFFSRVTAGPASSTMPMNSWPRMSPSFMPGTLPRYRCRSDPQIAVAVTRSTTSSASCRIGSGTVSTRTSCVPCQVNAFMQASVVGWMSGQSAGGAINAGARGRMQHRHDGAHASPRMHAMHTRITAEGGCLGVEPRTRLRSSQRNAEPRFQLGQVELAVVVLVEPLEPRFGGVAQFLVVEFAVAVAVEIADAVVRRRHAVALRPQHGVEFRGCHAVVAIRVEQREQRIGAV